MAIDETSYKRGHNYLTLAATKHLYPINGKARSVKNSATPWSCRDATWAGVIVGVDAVLQSETLDAVADRGYFLKARMRATHFLMKTLPKVASEMALSVLAYNLTSRHEHRGHQAADGGAPGVRRTWLPPLGRSGFGQDLRGAPKSKICSKRSLGGIRMVAAPRRPLQPVITQPSPMRKLPLNAPH